MERQKKLMEGMVPKHQLTMAQDQIQGLTDEADRLNKLLATMVPGSKFQALKDEVGHVCLSLSSPHLSVHSSAVRLLFSCRVLPCLSAYCFLPASSVQPRVFAQCLWGGACQCVQSTHPCGPRPLPASSPPCFYPAFCSPTHGTRNPKPCTLDREPNPPPYTLNTDPQ